jgi:hypothetical protein
MSAADVETGNAGLKSGCVCTPSNTETSRKRLVPSVLMLEMVALYAICPPLGRLQLGFKGLEFVFVEFKYLRRRTLRRPKLKMAERFARIF